MTCLDSRMTRFGLVPTAVQGPGSHQFLLQDRANFSCSHLTSKHFSRAYLHSLWLNRDRTAVVSNMLQIIDGYFGTRSETKCSTEGFLTTNLKNFVSLEPTMRGFSGKVRLNLPFVFIREKISYLLIYPAQEHL